MPTSLAPSSSRGGPEWVRLNPAGSSAAASGCIGLGCVLFGAVFTAGGIGSLIVTGSLAATLFVFAGLFIAAIGGWNLLAAVGPRPHLWADRYKVEAGETFKVRWEATGRFREASSIRITWEGCEVAVLQAYNSIFHTSTFATHVVTSELGPIAGKGSVVVPPLSMPSFVAKNARIEWQLRAEVVTRRWPDVNQTFAITVLPGHIEPR
jgi:hypothetical protein